jgi:hypothetical protein
MPTPRKTAEPKPDSTAKNAAKAAEANEEPTGGEFEYKGVTFAVPGPLDMPVEVLEAEDELSLIRAMVGPEQWAAFKNTRATVRDFKDFAVLVTETAGYGDLGN